MEAKIAKMFRQDTGRVPIHTLVIDCMAIHTIDSSAGEALKLLVESYKSSKGSMQVVFANWRGLDMVGERVLKSLKFEDAVPRKRFFLSIQAAVDDAKQVMWEKTPAKRHVSLQPSWSAAAGLNDHVNQT